MSAEWMLSNLLAWSAQTAIVVGVAWVASRGWQDAKTRVWFWQGVLVLIFLLPIALPWRQTPVEAIPNLSTASRSIAFERSAPQPVRLGTEEWILWALAVGCSVRLLIIGAGLARLAWIRRKAMRTDGPHGAEWLISSEITGPVTFGWLRPRIVLPQRILSLPEDARTAIEHHELVHVERKDWFYVIAEELARAAAWFHPAVWIALSKIQSSREEAVDSEVVRRTGNREAYVDALLAVAAQRLEPDLLFPRQVPAPLFLKKRQLATRVAAVLREDSMSKFQIASRFVAGAFATVAAVSLAIVISPLNTQAQAQPDGPGVTVETGGTLQHRGPIGRLPSAPAGVVVFDATLDRTGEVVDAVVISGPSELRRDALRSILGWHYEAGTPTPVRITVRFDSLAAVTPTATQGSRLGAAIPTLRDTIANKSGRPLPPKEWSGTLTEIRMNTLSDSLRKQLNDVLPARVGETITWERAGKLMEAIEQVDGHLRGTLEMTPNSPNVALSIALAAPPPPPPPPPPAPPAAPAEAAAPRLIRVAGAVQAQNILVKTIPAYPPQAKQERVTGVVSLAATIDTDGRMANLELISGPPLLVPSAVEAVKQWIYKPTLLNGQPVAVLTQIDVNYTLSY